MDKKDISHFLIKRSNSIRQIRKNNIRRKGFFELTIRKTAFNPPSAEIKPNDIVYVAESNGGIYAMGKVIESGDVETFTSIEPLLDFQRDSMMTNTGYQIFVNSIRNCLPMKIIN